MKILRNRTSTRLGFSLAELMVVIVIIGLLATAVVPRVLSSLGKASKGIARKDLAVLKGALDLYAIDNGGKYPDSLDALVTPDELGNTYIEDKSIPTDPWKTEYQYESQEYSGTGEIVLYSLGADKMNGGEGDNADIHWNDK